MLIVENTVDFYEKRSKETSTVFLVGGNGLIFIPPICIFANQPVDLALIDCMVLQKMS